MPFQGIRAGIVRLWQKDIWQTTLREDHSLKGWFFAFLRATSILSTTFFQTKTASRAADLSFSSMLGLGPLIAIAMLVGSKVFDQRNPHLAVDLLQRLISFVAPQLDQYDSLSTDGMVPVNPALVSMINGFIKGARSNAVGVVGAVSLLLIVLFLFRSIENVFNEIWGVRRGRTILMRVAFYSSMLTLGGLLFFAAVAALGLVQFVDMFLGRVPFGIEIVQMVSWSLPSFSFVVLVAVLAAFYRTIPNTRVKWLAALSGAIVVALLLTANNYLEFLYLRRVLLAKSLFGSLGIIPVLMFGLYVFWLFVLIGGQISYAIQNVDVRNSKLAWGSLSTANRERLSLVVLVAICRRQFAGKAPLSAGELSVALRLPSQVLNECLNRIVDLGYARAVAHVHGTPHHGTFYEPARPLREVNLLQFKEAMDNAGADPAGDALGQGDPLVVEFGSALEHLAGEPAYSRSLDELLAQEQPAK